MNLLVVSQYYWPEQFLINELCEDLAAKGHRVTVLTGLPNYPSGRIEKEYRKFRVFREERNGVRILRVPIMPRGKNKLFLALNYFSFALMGSVLGPILCRDNYDVVFVMQLSPVTIGVPGAILKTLKKIPMVFWVQDLWPESLSATGTIKNPTAIALIKKLVRWLYRKSDVILIQSPVFKNSVVSSLGKDAPVEYIPNWAPEIFEKTVTGEANSHDFNLIFAGNLGAAQNLSIYVEAAKKLKDLDRLRFRILGDGRARKEFETKVLDANLKDMFVFEGRRPLELMPEILASADGLLVSLRKDPIFSMTVPSKVQAYLATGRPILASLDGEGARTIAEAGAGFSSPTEDAEKLAANIRTVYKMSSEERVQLGKAGRAYFEKNFKKSTIIDRIELILMKLSTTKNSE